MRQTTSEVIQKIKNEKNGHEVMPTGLPKLDRILDGGFYSKEVVVIGAHTGTGKSQLAGQILLNVAKEGFKTAYFSLEISSEMILSRLVGLLINMKPSIVRFGTLTKEEHDRKLEGEARILALDNLISFYDDVYDIKTIAQEIKNNTYEFVVVDFIQNIQSGVSDEYVRLSNTAIELQKICKATSCTALVLSQLSNTAAQQGRTSKTLEYKGSGAIAMVCDLGFFLERNNPTCDDQDYQANNGTILTLKKNRRGISGNVINLGYELPGGLIYEK